MGGTAKSEQIVVVDGQDIEGVVLGDRHRHVDFAMRDKSLLSALATKGWGASRVRGMIRLRPPGRRRQFRRLGSAEVFVEITRVKAHSAEPRGRNSTISVDRKEYEVRAWIRDQQTWHEVAVRMVPVRSELFSRARGLLETAALVGKTVLVIGLGSVGSTVVRLLAQSGICRFILMDHDRLDVCNVIRHEAGLSHIGRFKTKVMADLIHEKNPYAEVKTFEEKVSAENMDLVRDLVGQSTLCINTGDEREGKLLTNRACLEAGTPLIVSGAFRRAHGGQVFRVRPGESACYSCFVKILKADGPAFPDPDAETTAYSDRPVPIEPGLSIDIDPISHMTAKLALQELLCDVATTLRSLDDDLEANWFLWMNRREKGTQYENWEPLGFGMDGMRILRWYGIAFERDPECPMCGDFADAFARRAGVSVTESDRAKFMAEYAPKEMSDGR